MCIFGYMLIYMFIIMCSMIYMFISVFSMVCVCSCGVKVRTCKMFVIFYEPNISFVYALV